MAGCGLPSWAPGSKPCRHRQHHLPEPRFLVWIKVRYGPLLPTMMGINAPSKDSVCEKDSMRLSPRVGVGTGQEVG